MTSLLAVRLTDLVPFAAAAALVACSGPISQVEIADFTDEQASNLLTSTSGMLRTGEMVMFVCGQSDGLAVYLFEWDDGYQPDGMTDGRMVFTKGESDEFDLIWRGVVGGYVRASEDGGVVQRLNPSKAPDAESWLIHYPDTGITETHNLVVTPDGELVDLWTTNKPTSLVGKSARLFRAKCKLV